MATAIERAIYHPIQRDRVTFLKTASETDGALTLVEVELAPGSAGFEQTLYVGYGLACDKRVSASGVPKDLLALGLLTEWSDTRLIGPLASLNPPFGLLARVACWRGVDAALQARYAPTLRCACSTPDKNPVWYLYRGI